MSAQFPLRFQKRKKEKLKQVSAHLSYTIEATILHVNRVVTWQMEPRRSLNGTVILQVNMRSLIKQLRLSAQFSPHLYRRIMRFKSIFVMWPTHHNKKRKN